MADAERNASPPTVNPQPERLRAPGAVRAELLRVGARRYAEARLDYVDMGRLLRDVFGATAEERGACYRCGSRLNADGFCGCAIPHWD